MFREFSFQEHLMNPSECTAFQDNLAGKVPENTVSDPGIRCDAASSWIQGRNVFRNFFLDFLDLKNSVFPDLLEFVSCLLLDLQDFRSGLIFKSSLVPCSLI